jgi:hypothetical protein
MTRTTAAGARAAGKLNRSLSQYAGCNPQTMATVASMVAVENFVIDAKHDIAVLAEALRACVEQLAYFAEPDQAAILAALTAGRAALAEKGGA